MSAWLTVSVWLVTAAGVACLVSYAKGRFNGYLKGYGAGRKAGHSDAEATIIAIRRSAAREVNALKQRGQATQTAIDYLYDRAQLEVEQLGLKPAPADGGTGQP